MARSMTGPAEELLRHAQSWHSVLALCPGILPRHPAQASNSGALPRHPAQASCHSERSEESSRHGKRFFAALRMTATGIGIVTGTGIGFVTGTGDWLCKKPTRVSREGRPYKDCETGVCSVSLYGRPSRSPFRERGSCPSEWEAAALQGERRSPLVFSYIMVSRSR